MTAPEQKRLFSVSNHHIDSSGPPPNINGDDPSGHYSYFENSHGEQLIFAYDKRTKLATLWHGDAGWDRPYPIRDGEVPNMVLAPDELAWLYACWRATGLDVKQK